MNAFIMRLKVQINIFYDNYLGYFNRLELTNSTVYNEDLCAFALICLECIN